MSGPKLVVSIVSGGSGPMLGDCVRSIRETAADVDLEIWVVDNCASFDVEGVLAGQPVQIVRNQQMLGFAANHNQVMRRTRAPFVFVLNDDTLLMRDCIQALLRALEADPRAALAGPLTWIDREHRNVQPSVSQHFPSVWRTLAQEAVSMTPLVGSPWVRDRVFREFQPLRRSEPVELVGGAAIMARREAIDQVGLMDEGFGMYYEETDWCRRMRGEGWRILAVAEASLVHFGGQTTRSQSDHYAAVQRRSRFRYLRKHHRWAAALVLDALLPPLRLLVESARGFWRRVRGKALP